MTTASSPNPQAKGEPCGRCAKASPPPNAGSCGAALRQAFAGIDIVLFGHLGDGSLHYNTFLPAATGNDAYAYEYAVNTVVYEHVLACGGTIAAEHGVGIVKRHWLPRVRSAAELRLMGAVKAAFDPHNIMNPGKLLPD